LAEVGSLDIDLRANFVLFSIIAEVGNFLENKVDPKALVINNDV
jgi:hypothetical protein